MHSGTELVDRLAQARQSLGQMWWLPLYHQLGVNPSTSQLFQTAGHDTQTAYTAYECLLCPAGKGQDGAGRGWGWLVPAPRATGLETETHKRAEQGEPKHALS